MLLTRAMKPSDHPEFFRSPAPEGRSRESTIVLDGEGRFWHDGAKVEHEVMAAALHRWIARHPDNGRYILTNGYDWTYFTVKDAPFFVRSLRVEPRRVLLVLSDGSEEDWDPSTSRVGDDDAVYAKVKESWSGGPFEAKFTRHAQASLAPLLEESTPPTVRIGGRSMAIGARQMASPRVAEDL